MPATDFETDIVKLCNLGFLRPRFFHADHWAAIIPNGSFTIIVDGDRRALPFGYQNRWVYRSFNEAVKALEAWDGAGDPPDFISAKRDARAYTVWP